jgi:uncharacterized FlaG/YvyC family protein
MDISVKPVGYFPPQPIPAPAAEVVQHKEIIKAARSINASGYLGQNQIVFLLERGTNRAILRVVDRETNEVLLQLPPESALRWARELNSGSALTFQLSADE